MIAVAAPRIRPLWRAAGYLCFAVGALGAALPLLPTTGPWILAVWCLWKGDDPLARRLLDHPKAGRHLRDWFEHGRICRAGKVAASLGMAAAIAVLAISGLAVTPLAVIAAILAVVATWLWARPDTVPSASNRR